jgi:hypothetical protein
MPQPEFKTFIERGPTGAPDDYQLWACRGTGRGCLANMRSSNQIAAPRRHCADCYGPLPKPLHIKTTLVK